MKGAVYTLCIALSIALAYAQTKAKPTQKPKPTTPKPTVAPGALKCRVYNVTVKITNTFSDDLNNGYSKAHNDLRIELEAGVHQAFDGYGPFQALKVNSYTKAPDGKILAQIFLEMKDNNTAHLGKLIGQLAKAKLGSLPADKKLVYAGCYFVAPAPVMCSYGCPTACAPDCSSSCCNQYVVPAPPVMIPAPPPPPPPPPPSCPAPCAPACAPTCAASCCQTAYPAGLYGKREHAPRPKKEDENKLKKHLLKKHYKASKH